MSWIWKKESKKTEKEKVAERREEVLAKGRKFKYPLQWTRHRIVLNTVILAFLALAIIAVGCWAALYRFGATDDLIFGVTKVFPLGVANVDGEKVLFSDYLILYRSSITSIEQQSGGQVGGDLAALQRSYKRSSLTEAEKYTYALKLGKAKGLEVTNDDIAAEFRRHLTTGGTERSEEGFLRIVADNFNLTRSEYERLLYLTLMRAKVETQIDDVANATATRVEQLLAENGGDLAKVAEVLGDAVEYENTGGLVDNKNIDGGRANMAMQLEPGAISERFVSLNGDGYYFVKLAEKTDAKVNFSSIKVPFRAFEEQFTALQEEGSITESITTDGVEN